MTTLMSKLVVSPDAIVRCMAGRIWVHTGGPEKTFASDSPLLLTALLRFAHGADQDRITETVAPDDRAAFTSMVVALRRIGALIEETRDSAAEDTTRPVDSHLVPLAEVIHRLAGTIAAMGPHAGSALAATTGVPIDTRLTTLLAGATALAAELDALRPDYVCRQLQDLGIAPGARGLKLHLGAGGHPLDGWVNIDTPPADLALDLRWGLPFEKGAADYVFLSHTLEHFYYPDEVETLLLDIHRVLAPAGRLRIIVPDVEKCIRAYVDRDDEFFASRRTVWTWWPQHRTRLQGFLNYAGAGPHPGDFLESHKFGYDFDTLEDVLRRTGFRSIERSEYMESRDPVLRVDEASGVAGATFRGEHYSLFVEAAPAV
jgi:SAM-dependent methyltransferase